jgi:hypothetical protein
MSNDSRDLFWKLDACVQAERRALRIVPGTSSDTSFYVTATSIPSLVGPTLLCRLLKPHSPLVDEDRWFDLRASDVERCAKTCAGVLLPVAERAELMTQLAAEPRLALPVDGSPAQVVREESDGTLHMATMRPFVFEDLRGMPSVRFHLRDYDNDEETGGLDDTEKYHDALLCAQCAGWSVTRHDLLNTVVQVARSLDGLHKRGLVHGDIKPANILVTKEGGVAHDSLDIKVGAVAAAGTKGWNSPEQVMARPVSPASDVFPLAQLVVKVLSAVVFGEERTFIVPVGNGSRIRESMLAEPDVYLDPNLIPFSDKAVAEWRALLRRSLALDADKRFPSTTEFADELAGIAARHPVPGRVSIAGLPGALTRRARGNGLLDRARAVFVNDDDAMAWALEDAPA